MRVVARQLTVDYQLDGGRRVRALDDASLTLDGGESVAVMGPSGAGKSTLALALRGLVPLSYGSVTYYTPAGTTDARQQLAVVLQRPESGLFAETVREELAFAPRLAGTSRAEAQRRIESALTDVGLELTYLEADPLALSGGEQRRVAIAAVLAADPAVLVMDEPTAGLDAPGRMAIAGTLERLSDHGRTVVLLTHDAELAGRTCRRLLVLGQGTVAYDGPTAGFLSDADTCLAFGIAPPAGVLAAREVQALTGETAPRTLSEEALLDYMAAALRRKGPAWVR